MTKTLRGLGERLRAILRMRARDAAMPLQSVSDGSDKDFGLAPDGRSWRLVARGLSSWVQDACFICGVPQVRPAARPKMACVQCRSRARLASSGALMTAIMKSTRGYPLEGSLLASLLNPIEIDGRRGWADFVAGGWGVHEELVASSDMFDFILQHDEPFRTWLPDFRALELSATVDRDGFVPTYVAMSEAARSNLDQLMIWWSCAQAGLVAQRPHVIRSNDDAWAAAERLQIQQGVDAQTMLTRIASLAQTARSQAPA